MTPYSDRDLAEGWEFKIVRAGWPIFRQPEQLRAVLDEERGGGWVLVEKFDDYRIRLKRPAGSKVIQGDFAGGYDPYRTSVGTVSGRAALAALGCGVGTAVFFIVVLAIAFG